MSLATFSFSPSDFSLPNIYFTLPYPFYSNAIQAADQSLWVRAYRNALWHTLPQSLHIFSRAIHVPFHLHSSHPTWQSVAWELLSAQPRRIYRSHAHLPVLKQVITEPLSILFLQFPVLLQHHRLALEQEQWAVQQQLLPYSEAIILTAVMVDSLAQFNTLLSQKKWTIIIISGHAAITREYEQDKIKLLINAQCSLTGQQVAELLQKNPPYLLLLNTCLSGMIPKNPNHSLLYPLLRSGITHLIAMQGQLLDRAALKFLHGFLHGLIQAKTILDSVECGRKSMRQLLEKNEIWQSSHRLDPSAYQSFLPVYYSQCPDDILLPNCSAIHAENPIAIFPPPSSIFIGRRELVQSIFSILIEKNFNSVLLQGVKGCGKTALAEELIRLLKQQQIIIKREIAEIENNSTHIIYFIDNPNSAQWEKIQQQWQWNSPPRYLLITDHKISEITWVKTVIIPLANYADFLAYAQQLGLPHSALQIRLMYRIWGARFRGLEILRTLPTQNGKKLQQQLLQIKRCLYQELASSVPLLSDK
ncbi:CHAT domain-containing protein [Thioflexithrix psekupsensis]|uniref:CHAT domain-containing protein n=1 Tax=Thioflexithrix psekupsensis TaxID=1570016 RepID=A0A251XBK4_9GAMM|nr:CHAT domain-containing protein [Thioflexithrix psekupsensis]OUD15470.1 hypothetical protein TPSD3_02790 [Thioflexithrix psekupsensis]